MIPVSPDAQPDLASIERRLSALENGGVNNNLDNQSKDIMGQILEDKIIDIVWNKYFHYFTLFEGASGGVDDRWGLTTSVGSTIVTSSGVQIDSATANTVASMETSIQSGAITTGYHSRMRTSINLSSVTAVKYYWGQGYGYDSSGVRENDTGGFGFFIENGAVICGVSNSTGAIPNSETLVTTGITLQINKSYILEIRNHPGYKIAFYISDPTSATSVQFTQVPLKEVAVISTTLPSARSCSWRYQTVPTESVQKTLVTPYFDYIQQKPGS